MRLTSYSYSECLDPLRNITSSPVPVELPDDIEK